MCISALRLYGRVVKVDGGRFLGSEFDSPLSICYQMIRERYGQEDFYHHLLFVIVQIKTTEIESALILRRAQPDRIGKVNAQ